MKEVTGFRFRKRRANTWDFHTDAHSHTCRPGLLVDIVRVLKDINLNVVSAEVDTVGTEARDEL